MGTESETSVIPLPLKMIRQAGEFVLTAKTTIIADDANRENAVWLRDWLQVPTGFMLPIQNEAEESKTTIHLRTSGDQAALGQEGYELEVTPESITITAAEAKGVFYGLQTLRQLLPPDIENRTRASNMIWRIPCVAIQDKPRFEWRGFMMDEGRHFHGKATMLRTLDLMALQKLNVLHWHLTEDQGWRIEILQYPKLTEVGSKRQGTTRGMFGKHDGHPHGGFYTRAEIREIVDYAAERQITIMPEIEIPGHSLAALASYPELSCTGGPFEVACSFGPSWDIYCAGKENVFTFLQNVLDEVMALFPSPYIHIGGDEAPKSRWKKCPDCRARIRKEGLKNEHALQVYFTNRIAAYLNAHGRRTMGWNQILDEGLVKSAAVHYWIGNQKAVVKALQQGHDVIMSPFLKTYLDHSYSLTPLSMAYAYEPAFAELNENEAQHILGLEAPLWSEMVPNQERLDYQVYPRLTAYAETGWSAREKKDWEDFKKRLDVFLQRLDYLGVRYARGSDVEPPWYKRALGIFTIMQPQTGTA